jgi:hypothetical protein
MGGDVAGFLFGAGDGRAGGAGILGKSVAGSQPGGAPPCGVDTGLVGSSGFSGCAVILIRRFSTSIPYAPGPAGTSIPWPVSLRLMIIGFTARRFSESRYVLIEETIGRTPGGNSQELSCTRFPLLYTFRVHLVRPVVDFLPDSS